MLDWLLELYRHHVDSTVVIVHPSSADRIRAWGDATSASLAYESQESPTGMLDAILLARERVAMSDATRIWITWCDQVGIHPETVARLADLSDRNPGAPLVMPTARRRDPYIHLERDQGGRIVRVLHRREGDRMPEVGETELGLFSVSRDAYLRLLPEFAASGETGAATGERNLLPFIPWLAARDSVVTFPCVDEMEAVGINTPEELLLVEGYLGARRPGSAG